MHVVRLGALDSIIVPTAAFEAAPVGQRLTVVLLHGYGASGSDLVGLGPELLETPALRGKPIQFVFLMAPLVMDDGSPLHLAPRAWWLLDMLRLQRVARGLDRDYLSERPAGMTEALEALERALDGLEARGVPRELIVLGGFSQGAMLSTHFTLSEATKPRGLVVLSGTFIDAEHWRAWMPSCRAVPVFQSHSPDDMVLPLGLARQLHEELVSAGLSAEFVEFRGGHGISRPVLLALADFLGRLVAAEAGDFASDAP